MSGKAKTARFKAEIQQLKEYLDLEKEKWVLSDETLANNSEFLANSDDKDKAKKGICRWCGRAVKRMKNGHHLYTHYRYNNKPCYGSRRLDYEHQDLILISEQFDTIKKK